MDLARKQQLLDQQIVDARSGNPANFDDWHNRTEVILRRIFGEKSATFKKFRAVRYSPSVYGPGMDTSGYRPAGVRSVISILESAKLELDIEHDSDTTTDGADASPTLAGPATKIFIVHGQDDARKFEVSSFLQNLTGEQPIILHQQPNNGQVLIEKFESNAASAGYAVVLLTGDDVGRPKALDPEDDQPRARQNVVFEMGFFFGLLGRTRVAVLYEQGVELPSDINGIVYIPFDPAGGWKSKLAVEIEGAEITVEWSAIGRS